MKLPTCHECTHLVPFKRCSNWMAAGLRSLHLGELADTPQRCPGYRPRAQPPPAPAAQPGAVGSGFDDMDDDLDF